MNFEQFWESLLARNPGMRRYDGNGRHLPIDLESLRSLLERAWNAGGRHEAELSEEFTRRDGTPLVPC